jgi:predicted HicB family RNase H-like nuclease
VSAHVPANTHVTSLIKSALAKADPGSASSKRIGTRGEDRVMLTLRIDQELQDQLTSHCKSSHVAVNAFICGLIQKDLKQRGI